MAERGYLPAAGRDVFLPLYDPLTRLLGFRGALEQLLGQAELDGCLRVLDIGCGTGTLAIELKRRHAAMDVTGIDPDPLALARAARKAERVRVSVRFERGFADALPFPDGHFDRVFSSMMFHHVPRKERAGVLAEARRVLRPGGRLEFVDLAAGASHNPLARLLHGDRLDPAADAALLARFADAGFAAARRVAVRTTLVGPLAYYQARVAGRA